MSTLQKLLTQVNKICINIWKSS